MGVVESAKFDRVARGASNALTNAPHPCVQVATKMGVGGAEGLSVRAHSRRQISCQYVQMQKLHVDQIATYRNENTHLPTGVERSVGQPFL